MKFSFARSWLITIISLAVIVSIVYYLYINADQYLHLLHISAGGVITLFFLSITFPFLNGVINAYFFQSLGANLSVYEGFLLAGSTSLANMLPLPGGVVAKGVYLKYKYNLPYTAYISATLALFFCSMSASGLVGLGILSFWMLFGRQVVSPVLLFAFALLSASVLVFLLPWSNIRFPDRVRRWVEQALQGWALLSQNPVLLLKLLSLQTSLMILFALRYWVAFHMLSQQVSLSEVMLMSSASILTQLVSIAPGGLGVQEVIVAAIVSVLGFDLTASVAAVELDRSISTFTIILIGWISTFLLGKQVPGLFAKEP